MVVLKVSEAQNGSIESKCSTQMAVFKVRVALTWQYSK
jgi:hypothetical protein